MNTDYSSSKIYKEFFLKYVEHKLDQKFLYTNEETGVCKSYKINDPKLFNRVVKMVNAMVCHRMYLDAVRIQLPFHCGSLQMKQYKRKRHYNKPKDGEPIQLNRIKNKVDFGATNKMWREMYPHLSRKEILELEDKPVVFHLQEETDGWSYWLDWKRSRRLKSSNYYDFKRVRGGYAEYDGKVYYYGDRGLARILLDGYERPEYPISDRKKIKF